MDNFIGKRYGLLVVESFSHRDHRNKKHYKCICDCGNITIARSDTLNKKDCIRSCGCIGIQKLKEMSTKHNQSRTRLYKIWASMKVRCNRKTAINYYLYGGRGIKVCNEWSNDFEKFREWSLANGYADDLTIDRINTNGDYEPLNCRWATYKEQANNRRNNTLITYNNETHTMREWGRITGVGGDNIYNRLQDGWSIEKALTLPVKHYRQRKWSIGKGNFQHISEGGEE